MHLFNTLVKLAKHNSNESPKTVKSSINTSIHSSNSSEKMLNIHLWKVAGALHNPKGIRAYAKVPKGQVKVVLC